MQQQKTEHKCEDTYTKSLYDGSKVEDFRTKLTLSITRLSKRYIRVLVQRLYFGQNRRLCTNEETSVECQDQQVLTEDNLLVELKHPKIQEVTYR